VQVAAKLLCGFNGFESIAITKCNLLLYVVNCGEDGRKRYFGWVFRRHNYVSELYFRIASRHSQYVFHVVVVTGYLLFPVIECHCIVPVSILQVPLLDVDHFVEAENQVNDNLRIVVHFFAASVDRVTNRDVLKSAAIY